MPQEIELDPIERILKIGYNEEIVNDIFNILCQLDTASSTYYTNIAQNLRLDEKYVHIILEIMANEDLLEYGVSPRGSWLSGRGKELLELSKEFRK